MASASDLKAFFQYSDAGVFTDIPDTEIDAALARAGDQVDERRFRAAYFNVAAHELASAHHDVAGVDDGAGIITQESLTGLQRSYSHDMSDWARSKYGRRAIRLLAAALPAGPAF